MKDYSTFRAPFIKPDEIRQKADQFRLKYGKGKIPVDIEEIVEFDLNIYIKPKSDLCRAARVDAAISSDCRTIHVDLERYMSKGFHRRVRFSIAHEIGHYELHRDIIPTIRPSTPEEWKQMVLTIPDGEYGWCESHAYEFAGRLLVPRDDLKAKLDAKRKDIDSLYDQGFPSDKLLERFSDGFIGYYDVSSEVISRRLLRENLWPYPLDLP